MILRIQSCTGKCSKVFLLLVNIIIFLVGGGCLGLGIYFHLNNGLYDQVFKEAEVITIPVILMTLGSIFLIISVFAIIGALCEVVCMLKAYMGIVAVILLLEVIFVVVCVAMRGKAEKAALSGVQTLMEHYGNKTSDELNVITKTIDQTQKWLKCCGITDPYDWNSTSVAKYWATEYNRNQKDPAVYTVPTSCCKNATVPGCNILLPDKSTTNAQYYTSGCKKMLYNFVDENITYISIGGLVLVLLQCFILICALKIRFELAKKYDVDDFGMSMTSL